MITYNIFTNSGKRSNNEDCANVIETKDGFCLALADGLGGHGKGEVASNIAVANSLKQFEFHGFSEKFLDEAFQKSQEQVLEVQKQLGSENQAKTTLVVAAVSDAKIIMGHIGDSRGYLFKTDGTYQRTQDHSVPQMLVNCGEIAEKDIRYHADRNRILKAVGMGSEKTVKWEMDADCKTEEVRAVLLCTDGFWEYIDETHMKNYLCKAKSVEEWMRQMIAHVRIKGRFKNMDNYTAIALWIADENKAVRSGKNGNCKLFKQTFLR